MAHELDLGEPAGAVGQSQRPARRARSARPSRADGSAPRPPAPAGRPTPGPPPPALRWPAPARPARRARRDDRGSRCPGWRSGCAITLRKPRSASRSTASNRCWPSGPGPRLDQQPAAVSERDALEHVVGELSSIGSATSPAGITRTSSPWRSSSSLTASYRASNSSGIDLVVRMDVRRRADQPDTVALGDPRHLDAVLEVARAVVEPGKDVAVEVDHGVKYARPPGKGHSELRFQALSG